jgi:hypothetical protein
MEQPASRTPPTADDLLRLLREKSVDVVSVLVMVKCWLVRGSAMIAQQRTFSRSPLKSRVRAVISITTP